MVNKEHILIAGGTGFIGHKLAEHLRQFHQISILTRTKSYLTRKDYYYWNPEENEIDLRALKDVTVVINLCGAGIADKRWTPARKRELLNSRVNPAEFLHKHMKSMYKLKQYISASGVNCYPIGSDKVFTEEDDFGTDFVSQLVKKWEAGADLFQQNCKVVKLRIGFVLALGEGGLKKMETPIKFGVGSVLGSGNQAIPWIHIDDLVSLFEFSIVNNLEGCFNAIAGNTTNEELTYTLAKKLKRKIFLPKTPGFLVYLIFGQMAVLLLKGIYASNEKIKNAGFIFKKETIDL
jgi:uncharacterized protein